jgi:hypothetical protein
MHNIAGASMRRLWCRMEGRKRSHWSSNERALVIHFNVQGAMIQTFPYSTTFTTRHCPQVPSDSSAKVFESDGGLVDSSLAKVRFTSATSIPTRCGTVRTVTFLQAPCLFIYLLYVKYGHEFGLDSGICYRSETSVDCMFLIL